MIMLSHKVRWRMPHLTFICKRVHLQTWAQCNSILPWEACDGDGLPDHVCYDDERWSFVSSANQCDSSSKKRTEEDDWDGTCTSLNAPTTIAYENRWGNGDKDEIRTQNNEVRALPLYITRSSARPCPSPRLPCALITSTRPCCTVVAPASTKPSLVRMQEAGRFLH